MQFFLDEIILIFIRSTLIRDYPVPDEINLVGDEDDGSHLDVTLLHQIVEDGDSFLQGGEIIHSQYNQITGYWIIHLNQIIHLQSELL